MAVSSRSGFVSSPWLVDISVKIDNGEKLTPSEYRRYFANTVRSINLWEMIFYWYQNGHMEEQSWRDWDQFYSYDIENYLTKEQWAEIRPTYSSDFVVHVDRKFN